MELVAHLLHYFGSGADESDPGFLAFAGETGVFRQETVAGVNRVGPGELGGSQNLADIQVALLGGRATQRHRLVGLLHRKRTGVHVRVDCYCLDAQLPAGAYHPAGNLAPICDQYLGKHRRTPPLIFPTDVRIGTDIAAMAMLFERT